MFERLKRRFKQEKGFTLVELLAVIAILAIIVAIAVPTIGNVVSGSEEKAVDANKELIENAARLAHVSDLDPTNGEYTLETLMDEGFLNEIPGEVGGVVYKKTDVVEVKETDSGGVTYEYTGDPSS